MFRTQALGGGAIALVLATAAAAQEPDPAKLEIFEKKVRPILVSHCYACHSADTKPAEWQA
jgi:hypothetical protein